MPKIASTHSHLFGGEVSAPDDIASPRYDRLKFGPHFGIFRELFKISGGRASPKLRVKRDPWMEHAKYFFQGSRLRLSTRVSNYLSNCGKRACNVSIGEGRSA